MRWVYRGFGLLCCLAPLALADAAPLDARVGQTRAVYKRAGTPLRAQPNALAAATATLPAGTQVRIDEVAIPWLRVTVVGGAGGTGYLRALETVEVSALAPNRQAVRIGGATGVSSRDVSAAGRQLDAGTEMGYRRSRAGLNAAYRLVDMIETATKALEPTVSMEFIVEGRLGRRGRDFARPAMLPPTQRRARRRSTQPRPRPTRPQPRNNNPLGQLGGLLDRVGGGVGRDIGNVLRSKEVQALGDVAAGLQEHQRQLSERFTPEQEYYLGRAVAAYAIAKYGLDPDQSRRRYVQEVGDAIVRLTRMAPANYGGYHFDVLNSDEINGVSGPGGFVLVTRGAVNACRSEAELAGLLCHELAHVLKKHGERVLRKGKAFPSILGGITAGAGRIAGVQGGIEQRLVQFFSQAVSEMSRTAVETGYGRNLEFEADTVGTQLLFDVYYEHDALQRFLARMPPHQHGHAGTHAPPQVRANALAGVIARWTQHPVDETSTQARATRFQARMGITAHR